MCSGPDVGLRDDHFSGSGGHCHTRNSFARKNAPTSGNLSPVEPSKSPAISCFQDRLDGRIDDRCVESGGGCMKPPCDEAVVRSANDGAPCTARTRRWILAATILGSSMAFIDGTVVNVALPALQTSLHATVVGVQWVVESYGLFLGALLLVGGSLGDLFGRKLMFLGGVAIFAAASIGCGYASNIQQLVFARSIQGVGAAFLVPGSLSIISACFDENTRGRAIGTWSGFTAITSALGPVLGGWLIEHASWRWIFFINVPLAVTVIAISLRHIPESRNATARQVDWLGALVGTVGLG